MTTPDRAYGLIAVNKPSSKVLFLDTFSYALQQWLNGFPPRPHKLVIAAAKMEADAPLYRHSVHGDNPHPGHKCRYQSGVARAEGLIDFSMLKSQHTGRIGDDGRLYLCCENSRAIVVIDTDDDRVVDQIAPPSANTHRLTMTPSGKNCSRKMKRTPALPR